MASCIHSANDLVTSHEQTRAGFIEAAMEKNIKAKPYIEQAKTLRSIASTASSITTTHRLPRKADSLATA